jgi:hypothetical protein
METMDAETMKKFQERLDELYGGIANPQFLELDTWYIQVAVEDANGRGYRCFGCGAEGNWEGVMPTDAEPD